MQRKLPIKLKKIYGQRRSFGNKFWLKYLKIMFQAVTFGG